jgi:hypothetical protein
MCSAAPAVVLLLLASVIPTPAPDETRRAPEGRWGGTGISIQVDSSGAKLEFDCAHGTIDAPLLLDSDGRFDLSGTFVPERPGPVRMGQEEKSEPARYSGRLDGETLTLEVHRPGAPRQMSPLSAVLGKAPRLRKCG